MDINMAYHSSGNKSLLDKSPIAVFCSQEIPLSVYHTAVEMFNEVLKLPITIAGGWQSTMEKRMLKGFNNDSKADIIFFLAKDIQYFTLPSNLTHLHNSDRFLVVAPSELQNKKRIETKFVLLRDELMLSLINRFLFLYINPKGHLHDLFTRCINDKAGVYILDHHSNEDDITEVENWFFRRYPKLAKVIEEKMKAKAGRA